jgi:hypothetical protein
MALSRITKVGGNSLEDPLNFTGGIVGSGATFAGVVTATSFVGDGSQLSGVSGFATALSPSQSSPLFQVFKTPKALTISAGTSVTVEVGSDEGSVAFTRASDIVVASGATFRIASGTTLRTNILELF